MTLDAFRRVLEVKAVGCWIGMKSVIEPMKRAGGGSIVNISSVEGFTGAAGLSAYSASKFAVRGMTKAAAQELAEFGIRVNSVPPGFIDTPMTAALNETQRAALTTSIPLGRLGTASDVASAVLYLASDEAAWVTGTTMHVNGGMAMP